ncbi:MAG: hypothetical protein R8K22_09050 [Mariprofundaceae bacterium]
MINVIGTQLLSIPQGAKPEISPQLPWQNGSILSAKLSSGDGMGSIILSLGGYRMRAQVPPNLPMGHVWLQLMSREIPPQFRLLSDAKAASVLSEMLAQQANTKDSASGDIAKQVLKQSQDASWQKLEQGQLPFQMDPALDGRRLMMRDREDGNPQGVMHRQGDEQSFQLRGRVDLGQLGPVGFSLEGAEGRAWQLRVYAAKNSAMTSLRQGFAQWLDQQQSQADATSPRSSLQATLKQGLPEQLIMFDGLEA